MKSGDIDPVSAALLLIDTQNDTLHPDGAFGRAGQLAPEAASLAQRLKPTVDLVRSAGGWIISTLFTLVSDRSGEPFITDTMRSMRPFLRKGDFVPGTWGHRLVEPLAPADITVEKIAFSGFYMTRLEWVLHQARIKTLVIAGCSTNGSISSTARDAHLRDFQIIVLDDGCIAFPAEAHRAAINDLMAIATVRSSKDLPALLKR